MSETIQIALIVAAAPTIAALGALVMSALDWQKTHKVAMAVEDTHKTVNSQREAMVIEIRRLEAVVLDLRSQLDMPKNGQ